MPIVTPGKRPGIRLSKSKVFGKKGGFGKKKSGYASLNLTPMVDMLTIIVIYLLQNFSADGDILVMDSAIQLPKIVSTGIIKRVPTIGIQDCSQSKTPGCVAKVMVNGAEMSTVDSIVQKQDGQPLEVQTQLELLRDAFKNDPLVIAKGTAFDGEVNIQADRNVEYKVLKKLMMACMQAGYGKINFAAIQGTAAASAEPAAPAH
jgi:biopolymer transport protein ExbD